MGYERIRDLYMHLMIDAVLENERDVMVVENEWVKPHSLASDPDCRSGRLKFTK